MLLAHKYSGFHLIEILITLTITAIISHWMLSNYQFYIVEERRREAEQALFSCASALEEFAIQYGKFTGATLKKLKINPRLKGRSYELQINLANDNRYIISAHPLERQAKLDKKCGVLVLTSIGEKSVTGSNSAEQCW
jgi:type IV pilus assembly protein PilE